jgi:hypothetical protein
MLNRVCTPPKGAAPVRDRSSSDWADGRLFYERPSLSIKCDNKCHGNLSPSESHLSCQVDVPFHLASRLIGYNCHTNLTSTAWNSATREASLKASRSNSTSVTVTLSIKVSRPNHSARARRSTTITSLQSMSSTKPAAISF